MRGDSVLGELEQAGHWPCLYPYSHMVFTFGFKDQNWV